MEEKQQLTIINPVVKQVFVMANYMYYYGIDSHNAMTILIPEDKRNGESELQREQTIPKSP